MLLPLIFLPAMPCDARMYADQVDALKDLVSPTVKILAQPTFAECRADPCIDKQCVHSCGYGIRRMSRDGSARESTGPRSWALADELSAGEFIRIRTPFVPPAGAFVPESERVIAEFAEQAIPARDGTSRASFMQMARDAGSDLFARQSDASLTRSDHWSTLAASKVPTLLVWCR